MRRLAIIPAFVLISFALLSAGVVGVFQGRVVVRKDTQAEAGILYVESRQGMARKVRVGDAVIEYDEDVPDKNRKQRPADSLCENTLVRVTAEQADDEGGPWRAISILILPEPKQNGMAPGQSFSFVSTAWSGQKRDKPGSKNPKAPGKDPRSSGTSGSCWVK